MCCTDLFQLNFSAPGALGTINSFSALEASKVVRVSREVANHLEPLLFDAGISARKT